MKLIINYDLMDKINDANNRINLNKLLLQELKFQAIVFVMTSGVDYLIDQKIDWSWILMNISIWYTAKVLMTIAIEKKYKNQIALKAHLELLKLSLQLSSFYINTNSELLKEAELTKTEYKVKFNEKFLPIIQQNKYILIPAYDSLGKINQTSILQEHDLNSKKWIISLGSPKKALKLVLNYT